MKLDKDLIIKSFIEKFTLELSALTQSAKAAHAAATHEESKAEDRHDTFAIEASYLAAGQATRVAELERTLQEFEGYYSGRLSTSLLSYESGGTISHVLFAHLGGGSKVQMESVTIQILSLKSPLGENLTDAQVGDVIIFENRGKEKEYRMLSLN